MAFGETKVYFDGSHYIAIPHTERPSKNRRSHNCCSRRSKGLD